MKFTNQQHSIRPQTSLAKFKTPEQQSSPKQRAVTALEKAKAKSYKSLHPDDGTKNITVYEHLRRNGLINQISINWAIGLRAPCNIKYRQYGAPSFFDEDDKKHKANVKNIKDIEYKGNFKDIMHIFTKPTSSPHKNLTQAKFECGLRRSSLEGISKFNLIPFKCKDTKLVSYLPPYTEHAKKSFENMPFRQSLKEEMIKEIGNRPQTVCKISAL